MSHFSEKVQHLYDHFWSLVQPFNDDAAKLGMRSYTEDIQTTLYNIIENIRQNYRYDTDQNLWGLEDYWASTDEVARARAGDCDDLALFASSCLTGLGIPHYVVIGHLDEQLDGLEATPEKAGGHVWIEVDSPAHTYIMELTSSKLYVLNHGDYSKVPYTPVESILVE